jgi:hypothetical protein
MIRKNVVVSSLAFLLIACPLLSFPLSGVAHALQNGVPGLLDGLGDAADDSLEAFRTFNNGWTTTASGTSGVGRPAELTWSIVPDGTGLPSGLGEPSSPSNLISFLDGLHHGGASPGGSDLTQRDWFGLFESSFQRWDELSGANFHYEPDDDGASLPWTPGDLGRRGDHRIGGHSIDGQISPTFLAYNYYPNLSDMVIDTDESIRWGDPEGNFIRFRNMLMHEVGHGLGLDHLTSVNADFLMEPFLATQFDGPQLDDILGIHRLYGDTYEEGTGNDNYLNATSLGRFWPGQSRTMGSDAADTVVEFTDVDFLSIDGKLDVDFFRFTLLAPGFIDLSLTPLGPSYSEGRQGGTESPFNTATMSDLSLSLWDSDGVSLLELANENGLGGQERLDGVFLFGAGDYFVSVDGTQNKAQFYELGIDVKLPIPSNSFDFTSIIRDFANRAGFDNFFGGSSPNIFNIPEPSTGLLMGLSFGCCMLRLRRAIA